MVRLIAKLRKASLQAGRDEGAVNVAGYLLTHVDKSRREALNRAKREPFVIYMMSVLSDFSLQQVGFEAELRDRISAAWRAEDYHQAAGLIPDEMLDSFMLCGTAGRWPRPPPIQPGRDGHPILQPVLQQQDQVREVLQAASLYGSAHRAAGWAADLGCQGGARAGPAIQLAQRPDRLTFLREPGANSALVEVAAHSASPPPRSWYWPAGRWPTPPASSMPAFSSPPWPRACCCTWGPTSLTKSTMSGTASTPSPHPAPATRCSRGA
jgi:hypothetical protein